MDITERTAMKALQHRLRCGGLQERKAGLVVTARIGEDRSQDHAILSSVIRGLRGMRTNATKVSEKECQPSGAQARPGDDVARPSVSEVASSAPVYTGSIAVGARDT
jgi:hypothetical protein